MARNISLTAVLAAGILLVSGAPAMAAGATASGYDATGVLNEVDAQVLGATAKDNGGGSGPGSAAAPGSAPAAGVTPAQPVANSGRELPFTGFDAGIVLLLGALLLGTGFAVRRSTRSAA